MSKWQYFGKGSGRGSAKIIRAPRNDDRVPGRHWWLMIALPEMNPEDEASDCELLKRFAADRDPGAFADLVGRHYGMVCGIGRRVLGDPHEAEDIAQAVFVLLAEKASALARRDPVCLARWLVGASFRLAQNRRRVLERRRRRERDYAEGQPTRGEGDRGESAVAAIDEAIAELPRSLRDAVIARHLRGLSYTEAAVELHVTPATFRGRLARAREILASSLAERGFALPATGLVALLTSLRNAGAVAPVGFVAVVMVVAKPGAAGTVLGIAVWKWAAALMLIGGIGIAIRSPSRVGHARPTIGTNPSVPRVSDSPDALGADVAQKSALREQIAARMSGPLAVNRREVAPADNGFALLEAMGVAYADFAKDFTQDELNLIAAVARGTEPWDADMVAAVLSAAGPALDLYAQFLAAPDFQFTASSYESSVFDSWPIRTLSI